MLAKKLNYLVKILFILFLPALGLAASFEGLGQIIRINTHLRSFLGKPSWTLIIRDIDHNQNIPYLFDVRRGENFWLAFTYGRNYLIEASFLQFSPYRRNPFRIIRVNNFCGLESHGCIARGESVHVIITGDLSPEPCSYSCQVLRFREPTAPVIEYGDP